MPITKVEVEIPNTRKYESGTAYDPARVYRNPQDMTVMELDGGPSVRDLEKMLRNDAQARQLATALKLPIKGAQFEFLATEGDNGERDFVEYALLSSYKQGGMTTPFKQVIAQMSNAIIYRFQAFEKVWKVQERGKYKDKVVLHKLGWRPPATCKLRTDTNGSFNGFQQDAYKGNKYIKQNFDPKRALVYIHGADENPILGMTPFDTIYKNYLSKLKVSFFYFAFLENVAFPRTIAKVAGDDPTELRHLLDKARMLAHNGIMGLYEHEEIESYESQRNTRDYQSALEYLNWEMARAALGQFLDLGTSGERGSFALSKDKSSFFFNQLEGVLDDMAETINNYVIADLVQYNFGQDASYPKLRFRPLNDETADAVLETYKAIIGSNAPNVTPNFMLQLMQRVEDILGLEIDPMIEYDDEEYRQIVKAIPTARENLLSKEARAGSGQNAVTGDDKNNNNQKTAAEDKLSATTSSKEVSDELSIVSQMRGPETPRTPSRRKRRRNDS